ncbi:hypothetical protein HDU76_005140, partial [Blyttiomyces sp. JEL0837]
MDSIATAARAAMNKICSSSTSSTSLLACSMRSYCASTGSSSTDPTCSDLFLLVQACYYDSGLSVVSGSQACAFVEKTCGNTASATSSSLTTTTAITSVTSTTPDLTKMCTVIPNFFSSLNAQSYLFSICDVMNMDDCTRCAQPSVAGDLATCDILNVYGSVCRIMTDMTNCNPFHSVCNANPSTTSLLSLCQGNTASTTPGSPQIIGGGTTTQSIPEQAPIMRMYLHTGMVEYVLFKEFVPRTKERYLGALVFVFTLAVGLSWVESYRKMVMRARRDWVALNPVYGKVKKSATSTVKSESKKEKVDDGFLISREDGKTDGTNGTDTNTTSSPAPTKRKQWFASTTISQKIQSRFTSVDYSMEIYQFQKACLRAVEVFIAYMLMLVVMQFNVGLIMASVVGVLVGCFVFEREEEEERGAACCIGPEFENSVEPLFGAGPVTIRRKTHDHHSFEALTLSINFDNSCHLSIGMQQDVDSFNDLARNVAAQKTHQQDAMLL